MRSPTAGPLWSVITFGPIVPVLRMHDVAVATRFYVDYLGCSVDWQDGEGDRPVYLQVSRGALVLHLSSHHGDGTPGAAVLVELRGLDELHAELHGKGYPFLNPGIEDGPGAGRQMELIDPSSNRLRFYQRATSTEPQ
jgi:catechol 2,3-dioxygenase-like lactoylglutathione lyase family enzyme